MLPYNVVVRDAGDGQTEVAAIDPVASMLAIDNRALKEAAEVVRSKLSRVSVTFECDRCSLSGRISGVFVSFA